MAENEEVFDSLPYIDPEPSATARANAAKLIAAYTTPSSTSAIHPSLPNLLPSQLTPILEEALSRASLSASAPKPTGIDTNRYLSVSRPAAPTGASTAEEEASEYSSSLDQAYTLSSYLRLRGANLSLLEKFGRNAWLTGNGQLEDVLAGLEREIAGLDGEIESVNRERKGTQEGVRGEVEALEEGWKKGLGRAIEAEIAAEEVGRQILEARRRWKG
ncbi:MAG: hypothetical protein M1814_005383 [Vezdaea aestivalis]|nr:MAG: hypothetical protein M1814_005383 [Vezdaea aestivalis]